MTLKDSERERERELERKKIRRDNTDLKV